MESIIVSQIVGTVVIICGLLFFVGSQYEAWRKRAEEAEADLTALRAAPREQASDDAIALLRELEWESDFTEVFDKGEWYSINICWFCQGREPSLAKHHDEGHKPDCKLARVLRASQPREQTGERDTERLDFIEKRGLQIDLTCKGQTFREAIDAALRAAEQPEVK